MGAEQSFDPEAAASPKQVSQGGGSAVPGLGAESGPRAQRGSRLPSGLVQVWLTSAVALEQRWWSKELHCNQASLFERSCMNGLCKQH